MIKLPQLLAVIVLVLAIRYMPWSLLPVPIAALYTWIHWRRVEVFLERYRLSAWAYGQVKRGWLAACAKAEQRIDGHVERWVAAHRRKPVAVVFCEPNATNFAFARGRR